MKIPEARIESFASSDPEAKIVMQCVYLDRDAGRLLATDGHSAARISVEVGDGDLSGLLPAEVFELARKELKLLRRALGKDAVVTPWLRIECGEDAVVVENILSKTNHIVTRPKLLEQRFPNIDAVFPAHLGARTVTLSRDMLAALLPVLDGGGAVTFWISAEDKPIAIAPDSGQVAVILMPMKGCIDGEEFTRRGAPGEIPPLFGDAPSAPEPEPLPGSHPGGDPGPAPSGTARKALDNLRKLADGGSVTFSIPSTGESITLA